MLNTTFALAKKSGACTEGYRKLANALGGITKYGKDTPIPLSKIIEINGLQDAIWALRCTIEPSENILIEFACRCAEHVLHFYEDKYPDDKRPRQAIEAARICITDKSPTAWAAAGDAAWAAWAAARDAARDAARAAWAAWAVRAAARDAARAAWAAWAVRDAAWAAGAAWAAWDAARAAAGDAAGAAGAAETEWQTKTLLELLNQERK